jgi:hypothetical protein
MQNQSLLYEIIGVLEKRFSIRLEYAISKDGLVFDFSNGLQKDYSFYAWVSPSITQSTIGASLKVDSKEKYCFWSSLNDLYGSEGPELEWTLKFLIENMEIILNHRTRIIQRKGWINMIFTLEYYKDGDWKSLGSTMAFRYSHFKFPKMDKGQKEKVWY